MLTYAHIYIIANVGFKPLVYIFKCQVLTSPIYSPMSCFVMFLYTLEYWFFLAFAKFLYK